MWRQFLSLLRSLRAAPQQNPTLRQPSFTRLRLEWLEDRRVPAGVTCTFNGGVGGLITDYSDPAGWVGRVMPGSEDIAIIAAPCVVNTQGESVTSLTVNNGANLTLDTPFSVNATSFGTGTATVNNGGTLTVGGTGSSAATLNAVNLSIGSTGAGGPATVTFGAAAGGDGLISGTTALASSSTLTVAGAGASGASGNFETANMTSGAGSTGGVTINTNGAIQVDSTATLSGPVDIFGKLTMEGSPSPGANTMSLGGTGTVESGGYIDSQRVQSLCGAQILVFQQVPSGKRL